MKSEYRIHSTPKLDVLMSRCCEEVLNKQQENSSYWGMVGACVLDHQNRVVYGVNHATPDNKHRTHAEVVAIKKYIKQYGKAGLADSIIVTTLSPCCTDIDQPGGINCTDYINKCSIKKVYCGYIDPESKNTSEFKNKKFNLVETNNSVLQEICKSFADTFLHEDNMKINEMNTVKVRVIKQTPDFSIRVVKTQRLDDTVDFTYEVLNADGVTRKTFKDKHAALSWARAHL